MTRAPLRQCLVVWTLSAVVLWLAIIAIILGIWR